MRAAFKPRPNLIAEGKPDAELFATFMQLVEQHCRVDTYRMYARVLVGTESKLSAKQRRKHKAAAPHLQAWLTERRLKLRTLRSEDVDAFLAQWADQPAARQSYAVVTQRFLNFLGLVDPKRGLQVDVPRVRRNRPEEIRRQIITADDLDRYLVVCGNDHMAALLGALLWETGLRISEVSALRWSHVHLEERLIEVPQRKGGGTDSVPFGPHTQRYLSLLSPGVNPAAPLFPSRCFAHRGEVLEREGLTFILKRYAMAAGWRREQMHPHAFRHSCATHLIRSGMDAMAVKELLNHSSVQTTQIYVNLSASDVQDAYHKVMTPGYVSPVKGANGTPVLPTCPKCGITVLPIWTTCPKCGHRLAGEPTNRELLDRIAGLERALVRIAAVPEPERRMLMAKLQPKHLFDAEPSQLKPKLRPKPVGTGT